MKIALWIKAGDEPPITDLLSDPIMQTLMKADRIFLADVLALVRRVQSDRIRASDDLEV